MKKLELSQMENLQGGMSCEKAFNQGAVVTSLETTLGPITAALGFAVFAGMMLSCKD